MDKITTSEMTQIPIGNWYPISTTPAPTARSRSKSSGLLCGNLASSIPSSSTGITTSSPATVGWLQPGKRATTEVPCVYVDHLTEAQKKAYILADNRMAMDAGWDEELLKVELESLQEMAYDLSFTGFDEKELADLMGRTGRENTG